MKPIIVIKPTAIFEQPKHIIAGHIISAPEIFPRGIDLQVYTSSLEVKNIQIQGMITTSPYALRHNLHGFVYIGDILETKDIEGEALISNMSYEEAYRIYRSMNE